MSEARTMGLRERKARQLRQQIVDTALRLFTQNGYENVTIDQIAADVEVSSRTINRIFGTKEEILLAEEAELCELLRTGIHSSQSTGAFTVALDAFHALDAVLVDRRDDLILLQRLIDSSPALVGRVLTKYASWEEEIGTLLAERFALPPAAARLIAGVALVCWRNAFSEWLTESTHRSLGETIDRTVTVLRTGL